ncbi:hypothetical protein [Lyngbya aestuarii]|uniref:hypothetical protein n=1 Tax=Lyngbya aestuarii TaxID=118322 RepID=UPI00403DB43E
MELQELNNLLLTNPVLIGIVTGTMGAFIGATFTLINTLIGNFFQGRREKRQWLKNNLQEKYTNCIYSLSQLLQMNFDEFAYRELQQQLTEIQKSFNVLLIYHFDDQNFQTLISQMEGLCYLASRNISKIPVNLATRNDLSRERYIYYFERSTVEELKKMINSINAEVIKLASKDARLN